MVQVAGLDGNVTSARGIECVCSAVQCHARVTTNNAGGGNVSRPSAYPPARTRYYGAARDFADLYQYVRANPTVFEGAVSIDNGETNTSASFELVHTGAGGDGVRFELCVLSPCRAVAVHLNQS